MTKTWLSWVVAFCLLGKTLATEPVATGQWRMHFAPSAILQMAQRHGEIFGLMATELMYLDKIDNRLLEMNRVHGLSGTGLSAVAYSSLHDILVVGYSDGRVDLVYGDNDVFTLFDIYVKDIGGGKSIRDIHVDGPHAYLAMPFGVVVVDLRKQEIKETYFIGNDNASLAVNALGTDKNTLYAATEKGLRHAALSSSNLNDYTAWETDTLGGETALLFCTEALGSMFFSDGTRIYSGDVRTGWRLFWQAENKGDRVAAMEGNARHVAVGVVDSTGTKGRVVVFDEHARIEYSSGDGSLPAVSSLLWEEDGSLWAGTASGTMTCLLPEAGKYGDYFLVGPGGNTVFDVSSTGRGVTMSCGGIGEYFEPLYVNFGSGLFHDGKWTPYTGYRSMKSITKTLEVPGEPGHLFFASSFGGLLEKTSNGVWWKFDADNSALQDNRVNQLDCRVNDMAFDRQGNLWMLNALSPQGLVCYVRDGTWKSYDLRAAGNSDERPGKIMVDYWGTKWVSFNNSELSVFKTDGNSVQGLAVDLNRGNTLTTEKVYCFVEDQLGHVWIGTDRGIKVIDQHARMFDSPSGNKSSVNAKTIKVPKDGFLVDLLGNSQVNAIAVDGANRKWIGTNGDGIYLVSDDGMDEIHHFTVENSPLLSDNITAVAVHDKTGEVFIGTDMGLVGYRGTATVTEGNPKEEARAFPNPVRPGYEGLINVRGLPSNAIVKITDTKGMLIYQGRATGGQISWDGYALDGKRPASGVLFVFACKETGSQKLACKIFYVR